MPELSVIICTYNPKIKVLQRVLDALGKQTLRREAWELVIIDNNSSDNIASALATEEAIIREERPGLANARIRGLQETSGEIIVFVDDDNVLREDYLEKALQYMQIYSPVGAIGGKAIAEYEKAPPAWFDDLNISLGCRDLGDQIKTTAFHQEGATPVRVSEYPAFSPIGTGLVIRRTAMQAYWEAVEHDNKRRAFGRTGKALISGEDNDIILTLLNHGWEVGYFPELYVTHLIGADRVQPSYLARMNYASSKSWVQVLALHGITIWPSIPAWSVLPRKVKAYFSLRAWRSSLNYIRWRGACGSFEGLCQQ